MKRILTSIFISLAVGMAFAAEFSISDVKDPNLKAALRMYGETGFEGRTNLVLNNAYISNIAPLGQLTKLVRLDLYNNRIVDISALSNLTSLARLSLGKNRIQDIGALSNIKTLRIVDLNNNPVRDISPLQASTDLEELDLRNTGATIQSFKYFQFSGSLYIYDRNGKFHEVPADQKEKWGMADGYVVPAWF